MCLKAVLYVIARSAATKQSQTGLQVLLKEIAAALRASQH